MHLIADSHQKMAVTHGKMAAANEKVANVNDCDNMLKAIEALSRAEIELQEAAAQNNTAAVTVYERKVNRIKQQIKKMGG